MADKPQHDLPTWAWALTTAFAFVVFTATLLLSFHVIPGVWAYPLVVALVVVFGVQIVMRTVEVVRKPGKVNVAAMRAVAVLRRKGKA